MRIGAIGAGPGTAAATYVVDGADADVMVFEKSRGVCGRAAARRRGDEYVYDYGANYLKPDDERVTELVTGEFDEGLVEVDGPVWTFDADGNASEGRDEQETKRTYEDGITRLAKHLFGATDATVHRSTRIESAERDGDGWSLTDSDGERHGPFDALLVNPPAPQTAELLSDVDAPGVENLADAASEVGYRTVWTAVLGYEFELDTPYYGLVNTDKEHEVGWISREECKSGHVPDGESVLVVQANDGWSTRRYDEPPEENVEFLAAAAADIVGDERLVDPDWTDHQGWKYALPESGVPEGAVGEANNEGVYPVGDWVAGEARLHAAVRNGLEVGETLVEG